MYHICFCLHISVQRLPRAQFIWRALLYASGNHYFPRYIYICVCVCVCVMMGRKIYWAIFIRGFMLYFKSYLLLLFVRKSPKKLKCCWYLSNIARYTDVWNRHRESKKTILYEIGSGTKLFITFKLKVIRHEERETKSFLCWLFHLPPTITTTTTYGTQPQKKNWSGLDEPRKSTFFFRGRNSTNCFFSNLCSRILWS